MERVIFVEVVDRRGGVLQRVRLARFPFRIGRALSCDVIVDDPLVSASHVEVVWEDEGSPVAWDLESENGLFCPDRGRVDSVPLPSGSSIRIGRTLIRVRHLDEEVAPTVIEAELSGFVGWLTTHWSAGIALLVAVLAVGAWRTWASTWAEVQPLDVVSKSLSTVMFLGIWAGGWAIVTRLLRQESHFGAQWAVTCSFFLAEWFFDGLSTYLTFFGAPIQPVLIAKPATDLVLRGLGLFAQLSVAGFLTAGVRAGVAGVVAAAVVGGFGLGTLTNPPKWTNELPYWSHLKPIGVRWLPTEAPGGFFDNLHGVRDSVDRLAAEDPKG